ncbi:MAG: hypothetical protein R3C56_03795 [Pirellulaceae bacterium]
MSEEKGIFTSGDLLKSTPKELLSISPLARRHLKSVYQRSKTKAIVAQVQTL